MIRHSDNDDPYEALSNALDPGKVGIDGVWHARHLIGLISRIAFLSKLRSTPL